MDHRVLVKQLLKSIALEKNYLDRSLNALEQQCNTLMSRNNDLIIRNVLMTFFHWGMIAGSKQKSEIIEEYIHNFGRVDKEKWK